MIPEVSIIVPTYNSETYITQALKSVFNQSYDNWEIILVDDASIDSTVKIARGFPDKRLKIIENARNRGVSYGRNRGIKEARGKWIALLDSDDWYAPERLSKLLNAANSRDTDLIADDLFLIADRQSKPWSTLLQENQQRLSSSLESVDAAKFVTSDRLPPIGVKRNWSLGYTKPLIRREFLLQNNIWYREDIKVGEDFILYLECLRRQAKFYLVTQPYYYYRTCEVSLSSRKPVEFLTESCNITKSFIDLEIESTANPQTLEALEQNLAIFQQRLAYYQTLENLKAKKLLKATLQLLDTPYVLKDLLKKSLALLGEKKASILYEIRTTLL